MERQQIFVFRFTYIYVCTRTHIYIFVFFPQKMLQPNCFCSLLGSYMFYSCPRCKVCLRMSAPQNLWETSRDQKPHKSAAFSSDRMYSGYLLKVAVKPSPPIWMFHFNICTPWDFSQYHLCSSPIIPFNCKNCLYVRAALFSDQTKDGIITFLVYVLFYVDFSALQDSATVIEIHDSVNKCEEDVRPHPSQMEEKAFAANLHAFMKNRGSPIERIPHLGFKQSESLHRCCFTQFFN